MASEIAKAYVQIIPSAEGISSGIQEALGDTTGIGNNAGLNIANGIKTAISVAGIAAALTGAFAALDSVAGYGDHIDKMSQKMGMASTTYQEWDAVMQHCGTSMESMKMSMKTLANAAENGNSAFEQIGLSMEDVASMSQEDLFEATIAGLQGIEDTSLRTYLAGQLMGRGATELGPLLNSSAEDIEAMRQRVHELGGVMSEEAVKDAAKFKDALQDLQTAFGAVSRNALAPMLGTVADIMNALADIIAGNVQKGMDALEGIFSGIAEAIPGFLQTGMDGISQFLTSLQENAPAFLEQGVQMVNNLVNGLISALPGLISGALSLGAQLISTIGTLLPSFIQSGAQIVLNMITGLISNLPAIVSSLLSGLMNLLTTALSYAPQFLTAGIQYTMQIAAGLIDAIPDLLSSVGQVAQDAWNTFKQTDWISLGSDIISGIVSGIAGAAGNLFNSLKNLASNALEAAKSALNINSPSKVFRDVVGRGISEGIAAGIDMYSDMPIMSVRRTVASVTNAGAEAVPSSYNNGIDMVSAVYNAVREGMEEANVVVAMNERELGRMVRDDLGVALG